MGGSPASCESSYKRITDIARLISVTGFNFTHPPLLSTLLLIFSASRFLVPNFPLLVFVLNFPLLVPVPNVPLLVLAPFPFQAPLRGTTPFLSDRNPLWTPSSQTRRHFCSPQNRPAIFPFRAGVFFHIKSLLSV